MCGIIGYYKSETIDRNYCCQVLDQLRHRGPDAQGHWVSVDRTLFLGHRRLKILDLSDSANQPMISPDGRFILVYNGEIVNYRRLRSSYNGPWNFVTDGDTEILLAMWSDQGLKSLDNFVGMFGFAVFDTQEQTLTLVRDRFGIKPLYYAELDNNGFAFASEIPPLLSFVKKVEPDKDMVRTYLETCLYELDGRTFFSGIKSVGPGSCLVIDLRSNEVSEFKWYDLPEKIVDYSSADFHELVEEGERIIVNAIRDHLIADVNVGLNVSGGVDSSLLVSVARNYVSDIHLFSQDYEPPYSEAYWVKEIAGESNLHLVPLTENKIRACLENCVGVQAEPFGGVTVIGYDYLYKTAVSEKITVLLDGNGVDEVFLGYDKYNNQNCSHTFLSIDGSNGLCPDAISDQLKKDATVLPIPDYRNSFNDSVRAAAAFDLLVDKIPRGLRFNDRMSMAQSRELRVPFLDHRVVEFGFAVPRKYLLAKEMTKMLFRTIAGKWIPEHVAKAKKRSVQSPQREWLAGPWRGLVTELINSDSFADRGWVNQDKAQRIFFEYLAGSKENSLFLWQWINLELWARRFFDC